VEVGKREVADARDALRRLRIQLRMERKVDSDKGDFVDLTDDVVALDSCDRGGI
jgi:hypothetical protein